MSKELEDSDVKAKYYAWCGEMHRRSRKERSTQCFYGKEFWKAWEWRWGTMPSVKDKVVIQEREKKMGFLRKYELHKVKNALDIGCAFGFFVQEMRKHEIDAWGCDVSEIAVSKAPKDVCPFLKVGNCQELDWEENAFELVTAFDLLEHLYVEEYMKAISEFNRVASKFIVMQSPIPSWNAEPWLSDLSYHIMSETKEHVSIYPWEFWAKRFCELGKFDFWFSEIWSTERVEVAEGWLVFRRKQ